MARIRTIKPEFFTSEDIVELEPLARLLYIALWCEADKEGRLAWKPKTFKMRYLPIDGCDIDALCDALLTRGLIVTYGDGLAYIPSFKNHQHINPREKDSVLPAPTQEMLTREPRVNDASVTDREEGRKEGKGKEGREEGASPPVVLSFQKPEKQKPEFLDGFTRFWDVWPTTDRKEAKGKCFDLWKKAKAEGRADEIVAHVERLKLSQAWTKNNGEFIPAPLVYLNQRRWEGAETAQQSADEQPAKAWF
jgi:hypothetical protein